LLVVGKRVGLGEGTADGIWLGEGVGTKDGLGLGMDVGYIVCGGEGLRVGNAVGLGLLPGVGIFVGYNDSQQIKVTFSYPVTRNLLPLYSVHTDSSPITGSFPSQVCSSMYR
jgi:glycine cleavage system aminomethyltransferase T